MKTLVLASGNKKKILELQALLPDKGVNVVPQSQFNISDAIEDGLSFVENAIIKARHASQHSQLPAIADDSGIEVDALKGAPGIFSARFANHYYDGGFPLLASPPALTMRSNDADSENNALFWSCFATCRRLSAPHASNAPLPCSAFPVIPCR